MTTEQRAIAEFGLTDNPLLAGYILRSGDMLDFGGGEPSRGDPRVRARDHREIGCVLGDVKHAEDGWEVVRRFLRATGAIRLGLWRNHPEERTHGMMLHWARVKGGPSRMQQITVAAIMRTVNVDYAEVWISPGRGKGGSTQMDLDLPTVQAVLSKMRDASSR